MDITSDIIINTLLEKIVSDLLPIINEYVRSDRLFAIGKYHGSYPGYCLHSDTMIREGKLLTKYYPQSTKLYVLDDIVNIGNNSLCCDGLFFKISNGFNITCRPAIKGEYISLEASYYDAEDLLRNIKSAYIIAPPSDHKPEIPSLKTTGLFPQGEIGLFVKNI